MHGFQITDDLQTHPYLRPLVCGLRLPVSVQASCWQNKHSVHQHHFCANSRELEPAERSPWPQDYRG